MRQSALQSRLARAWKWALLVLIITAVGGFLRFEVMNLTLPVKLYGDEIYYVQTATSIARGLGHYNPRIRTKAAWPPAYPYLLSHFIGWEEQRSPFAEPWLLRPVLLAQVVLGTLLIPLVALLGRALFDRRSGIAAAFVVALYPPFIAHSHYLLSETLFMGIVCAGLAFAVAAERRDSVTLLLASGVSFGLAALTREAALPIAMACAVWLVWVAPPEKRRPALLRGVFLLGTTVLVILPWTWRNYLVFDRFIPVSTHAWMVMRLGNPPEHANGERRSSFLRRYFSTPGELEQMDLARREAFEQIWTQQPTWILKKVWRNVPQLFEPAFPGLFRKILVETYLGRPSGAAVALSWLSSAFYMLLMVAAILGIAAANSRKEVVLAVLVVGSVVATSVISLATPRFRISMMPLLIVYSGYALVSYRSLPRRIVGVRRPIAALVLLAFLGGCARYFYALFVSST